MTTLFLSWWIFIYYVLQLSLIGEGLLTNLSFSSEETQQLNLKPEVEHNGWNYQRRTFDSLEKPDQIITTFTGQSVDIPCSAIQHLDINIDQEKFTWKINSSLLNLEKLDERFELKAYKLHISKLYTNDSGLYSCHMFGNTSYHVYTTLLNVEPFTNNKSEDSSEPILKAKTILSVPVGTMEDKSSQQQNVDITIGPPEFKKSDKMVMDIRKPSGNTVNINCVFISNPASNITWTRDDKPIMRQSGKVEYKRYHIVLKEVIPHDSGNYSCKVCNEFGCIEHKTNVIISDRLRSRPIHSDRFPMNQTVKINNNALFECRVVSDTEPTFLWVRYINGTNKDIRALESLVPIFSSKHDNKDLDKRGLEMMSFEGDNPHILRLTNVTHDDEGWYTCIAANGLGQSVASAYLRVVDKLPTNNNGFSILHSHPIWITVIFFVVVLLFSFGAIFIVYMLRKLKHEKLLKHRIETVHQWTKRIVIEKAPCCDGSAFEWQVPVIKIEKMRTTTTTLGNGGDTTQPFNDYEFPLDANWEIPRNQLTLGSTLGEGAFGRVVMGEAEGLGASARIPNPPIGNKPTIVAVKMVKEEHTDADIASLVREMEVMKLIGKHINIINLLACCSQNGPLWVIVEYAPHGNLKDFLKQNRPMFNAGSLNLQRNSSYCCSGDDGPELTEKKLISFAFQIARGMEYLASRKQPSNKIIIKQKHLIEAFNTTRPSLNGADVARYKRTYARFTNKEKGSSTREYVAKRATLA